MKISTGLFTYTIICLLIIHFVSADIQWKDNWASGCDFNGNDLANVQIRGEDCGGKCASTPGCTHFTWTTFNGGTCWMKKGGASQGNAVATSDNSMVCGVMTSGPPGPENEGTTTRYWDCCKPSCSWSANVLGGKRVNTCYRDGNTVTNNPNAVSGCGGGEAFACNNQKPWAVNDQLAYGFAAATIPGLSKQERCCSCYKLVFTSGPVEGKTMIVQVTNSGDDVGAHQFDLQIPGGGVGLFNGCTNQWGAPQNGWGQQYGGISSRRECYSLPEQIRDGCLFRFDWFRGADNPRMRYSKVTCPSELVGITGCSHD